MHLESHGVVVHHFSVPLTEALDGPGHRASHHVP
jgi:hypothetical protein